jgi:hypothetical protein
MMILIGLLGKLLDCAQAVGARLAKAPAVSAPTMRRREGCCFMFCLLVGVEFKPNRG